MIGVRPFDGFPGACVARDRSLGLAARGPSRLGITLGVRWRPGLPSLRSVQPRPPRNRAGKSDSWLFHAEAMGWLTRGLPAHWAVDVSSVADWQSHVACVKSMLAKRLWSARTLFSGMLI